MKKYIAEFIGTFVLVFFACGTAAVTGCTAEGNAAYLITALAFGLVIVAMAYSIGNVSGCHINPAVSIAMLFSGKMSMNDFIGYVCAQFLGGIVGAGLLAALTGKQYGLGTNGLYDGSILKSLVIEIILTCVFVMAILGVTSKEKYSKVAGLVIGSLPLIIFGVLLIAAAAGDIWMAWLLTKENPRSMVLDHPSEAGFYVFDESAE